MRAVRKRDREDPKTAPKAALRCAVYTRKSSDEGLEQEFNSLDAQRECRLHPRRGRSQYGPPRRPRGTDDPLATERDG